MEHYDRNAFNPMLILCDGDAGREGAREREREREKKSCFYPANRYP